MLVDQYHISDEAYDFLVQKAIDGGFVRPEAKRNAGITDFFNHLAYYKFVDNRPKDIRRQDDKRKANRYVPIWNLSNRRAQRSFALNEEAIQLYIIQAVELQIVMSRMYKGGPYWRSGSAAVAAVLEALGIQYLVPEDSMWPKIGLRKEPLTKARDPERDTLIG